MVDLEFHCLEHVLFAVDVGLERALFYLVVAIHWVLLILHVLDDLLQH